MTDEKRLDQLRHKIIATREQELAYALAHPELMEAYIQRVNELATWTEEQLWASLDVEYERAIASGKPQTVIETNQIDACLFYLIGTFNRSKDLLAKYKDDASFCEFILDSEGYQQLAAEVHGAISQQEKAERN